MRPKAASQSLELGASTYYSLTLTASAFCSNRARHAARPQEQLRWRAVPFGVLFWCVCLVLGFAWLAVNQVFLGAALACVVFASLGALSAAPRPCPV